MSMWRLRVAGAQNTSFILARPNEKFSDLPRHPYEVNPPDICVVCDQDNGDDDSPLECDKVRRLAFPSPHHNCPDWVMVMLYAVRLPLPFEVLGPSVGRCARR